MEYCCNDGYEFVTPEHLLEAMMRDDDIFVHVLANFARTDEMLNELITKYGFESEPTLYFAKYAWKDLYNSRIYFETAINWHFIED